MEELSTPPAGPSILYGRDDYINPHVNLAIGQQPARIAITGAGGIGKTTVALAILHDARVPERFDRRRYFVSCEGMIDADGVIRRLARVLSLRVDGDLWSAIVQHLKQHQDFPRHRQSRDDLDHRECFSSFGYRGHAEDVLRASRV